MNYEDALKEWGARRIEQERNKVQIDRSTVRVEMEFKEGYACCGGTDPDCYCSFAESPSANVKITGNIINGRKAYSTYINHWSFDFAGVLREIVAAGGGTVTSY